MEIHIEIIEQWTFNGKSHDTRTVSLQKKIEKLNKYSLHPKDTSFLCHIIIIYKLSVIVVVVAAHDYINRKWKIHKNKHKIYISAFLMPNESKTLQKNCQWGA